MVKRKGKASNKNRKKQKVGTFDEPEELKNAAHSFVLYRGIVDDTVADLTRDFRKVMEPFTASALKARKANTIKDFLAVSGLLHVTHMVVYSETPSGIYLKLARTSRGPTLYFKVLSYSLARDVISSVKKQLVFQKQFEHPPLVILNNFSDDVLQKKLMASMFQNMFPPINVAKINLSNVRRCVLFHLDPDRDEIEFRHYGIKVVPIGLSRGVKKIVQNKVPDLSRFSDISEFITKAEVLSESEVEDDPNSHVTLPQKLASRGNEASCQSSIRLSEIGPRMTLQLIKIEDGFFTGDVLYHRFIVKTPEEKQAILKNRLEKRRLKEERKRLQAEAKRRKEAAKEENKKKSLEGMKRKEMKQKTEGLERNENNVDDDDDDDDAEWYRKEVGKNPENDLFSRKRKKPLEEGKNPIGSKKFKKGLKNNKRNNKKK